MGGAWRNSSFINRAAKDAMHEREHFCSSKVGHVDVFYPAPMLEMEGWDERRRLADLMYEDAWGRT